MRQCKLTTVELLSIHATANNPMRQPLNNNPFAIFSLVHRNLTAMAVEDKIGIHKHGAPDIYPTSDVIVTTHELNIGNRQCLLDIDRYPMALISCMHLSLIQRSHIYATRRFVYSRLLNIAWQHFYIMQCH